MEIRRRAAEHYSEHACKLVGAYWRVREVAEFANRLLDALDARGIEIPGRKRVRMQLFGRKAQKFAQPVERLSELSSIAKVSVGASFAFVRQLLSISGAQIQSIRESLGAGKRVIVITDDLDRTDPKLIPTLLLSFREFLDLPGFSFVMGFDDEIVGKALAAHHPAWTTGTDFLEKILDFRLRLPHVTDLQRARLFVREMTEMCPFVEPAVFKDLESLLPSNPRKLKALVRNIAVLRSEVARHNPEELRWEEIMIAQLMKMESALFLERFLEGDVAEEQAGLTYGVLKHINSRATGSESADDDVGMVGYMNQWGITDPAVQSRLLTLVGALRVRSSGGFKYQAQLASHPHKITWKEFGVVFSAWRSERSVSAVEGWVKAQAAGRCATLIDVAAELGETALQYRAGRLDAAANEETQEGQESAVSNAMDALSLVEALSLADDSPFRYILNTPDLFSKVLGSALGWIHFQGNPADRQAREQERTVLLRLARSVIEGPSAYLECIKPWAGFHSVDRKSRDRSLALRQELTDVLLPRVIEGAIDLMNVPQGVRRIWERGKLNAYKYYLSNKSSPVLTETFRTRLFAMLDEAGTNPTVHENALELLDFLMSTCRQGNEMATPEDSRTLLQDAGFSSRLWKAVISRRIQYRGQLERIAQRSELIKIGVPEDLLPLPSWLKDRLAETQFDRDDSKPGE